MPSSPTNSDSNSDPSRQPLAKKPPANQPPSSPADAATPPSAIQSSRTKFVAYQAQRKSDPNWATQPNKGATDAGKPGGKPAKHKRSRSFFALFKSFWALTKGKAENHRPWFYLALCTLTITALVGLVIPASTKVAIDYILTDNPGPTGIPNHIRELLHLPTDRVAMLYWLSAAMISAAVVMVTVGTIGRWQVTRITKRLQSELRRRAFEHAADMPLHRIQHYKSGGMASILRDDAGAAAELLFSMIYNPWRAVVQLVGTLIILAFVDWRMLAGGLLIIPVVWVSHKTYIGRIRPLFRDRNQVRQSLDATTTEAFGGFRVVRGFGREHSESLRFTSGQHFMTRIEVLTWWWSRILETAWTVMIPIASAAVLVYGGSQVVKGALSIGDLMMFSTYLLMLLSPLETLTSTAASIQTNLAALDRVLDLLEEPLDFDGKLSGKEVTHANTRGAIELRSVTFAYPKATAKTLLTGATAKPGEANAATSATPTETPEPVLRNISLSVKPGETIALVGRSGSGKTTLCNLVARFCDPTTGAILLDGTDLREINVHNFRRLLGIVEQDVFLFDGTIADNIAYARSNNQVTQSEIEAAARAANAHTFISSFEKGYATVIGERGVRLSGGQKQRLAIARALLADPRILILDEATSNLDSESEALIQLSLDTMMKGRTCFVIAHRLSTIRRADRIVVLDRGTIAEVGTHDELIERGGLYRDMLNLQLSPPTDQSVAVPQSLHPATTPA